jgi:hypothetical protein
MSPFRGNCLSTGRAHAAPWRLGGRAAEAHARPRVAVATAAETGVGEAIYELAELDRLRGASRRPRAGYREAGQWGGCRSPAMRCCGWRRATSAARRRDPRRRRGRGRPVRARLLEPVRRDRPGAGDVAPLARPPIARGHGGGARRAAPAGDGPPRRRRRAAGRRGRRGRLGVLRRAWEAWPRSMRRTTRPGSAC